MTQIANFRLLNVTAGVEPSTDMTNLSTPHYTHTDKIRFRSGKPEKIGGWLSVEFDNQNEIRGTARSIFTDFISGKYYTLIGSHIDLSSLIGSRLTNITPLQASPTAAANSLDSHYDTLGSDPIATTTGSADIVVTDSEASNYREGDTYVLSGSTAVNGITAGQINTDHIIRNISGTSITLTTGGTATGTGSGGGASVVRTSGLITLNDSGHGLDEGDRVEIAGAADFAGFTASTEVNLEFIIRNVATNSFDFMTAGEATSSVTSGGGASTEYYPQIAAGVVDETNAQGYGAGLYGVGLYGTALISSTSRVYPRIWFSDRYGNTLISTAGGQTGVYQWDGDTSEAPVLISNAPTEVNYAFISNNILVTLGAGGTENRVFASDQGNITQWTSSSTNQVFDDDIEGAGRLTSHVKVNDFNLLFTEHKTYSFRYIGLPLVWEIKTVDEEIGLIAPMARISVNGIAYWMGQENFYYYDGGSVKEIPSNTRNETTILKYVFDDINRGQKSKTFCWYNKAFNEIWWHYPSAGSNEPDRVARVCLTDLAWSIDTFDRTAAEYPNVKLVNPLLIDTSTLYKHELGNDANGAAMTWTLTTNLQSVSRSTEKVSALIPDSTQIGDVSVTLNGYQYPNSQNTIYSNDYTVSETADRITTQFDARFWSYTFSGSELSQSWRMGQWLEEIQTGVNR